jgi:hypothetical protein
MSYDHEIIREKIAIRVPSETVFIRVASYFEKKFGSPWRGDRPYKTIISYRGTDDVVNLCINISKDRMDYTGIRFYEENYFKVMTFEEYLTYTHSKGIEEESNLPRRIRLRR